MVDIFKCHNKIPFERLVVFIGLIGIINVKQASKYDENIGIKHLSISKWYKIVDRTL